MTFEGFRRTQTQLFLARRRLSSVTATMDSRIRGPEDVVEMRWSSPIDDDFRDFLVSLGCRSEEIEGLPHWAEVRAFNAALSSTCMLEDVDAGAACLGSIEYAFDHVSGTVGRAVLDRGWLTEERLAYYRKESAQPAAGWLDLCEPGWDEPERRYRLWQGVQLGAYLFDRLFRDLDRRAGGVSAVA